MAIIVPDLLKKIQVIPSEIVKMFCQEFSVGSRLPPGLDAPADLGYNDYRMEKTIEFSIVFSAKLQVWRRMIPQTILAMLIARMTEQKSIALLPGSFVYAKLPGATLSCVAPSDHHYNSPER